MNEYMICNKGISRNAFLWTLLAIPLIYPYCLNNVLPHSMVGVLRLLTCASALLFFLTLIYETKNNRHEVLFVLVVVYALIMVTSTVLNKGQIVQAFFYNPDFSFVTFLGLVSFLFVAMKRNSIQYTNILLFYFVALIILNLFTIILFPKGIYVSGQNENFLLGYDNIHCTVFFFAIALSLYRDSLMKRHDVSKLTILLVVLFNVSVFLRMSGTTVLQTLIFDASLLFRKWLRKIRLFNAYTVVIANIALSIFLVYIYDPYGNGFIQYAVVHYLHKNPTFTSRIYIWEVAKRMISENPWLGYGFDMDYAMSHLVAGPYAVYHVHNQYLTDLYYGGIPMLILLLSIILYTANRLNKASSAKRNEIDVCLIGIFFATIFHWNVESMHLYLQIGVFVLIAIYARTKIANKRSAVFADSTQGYGNRQLT